MIQISGMTYGSLTPRVIINHESRIAFEHIAGCDINPVEYKSK